MAAFPFQQSSCTLSSISDATFLLTSHHSVKMKALCGCVLSALADIRHKPAMETRLLSFIQINLRVVHLHPVVCCVAVIALYRVKVSALRVMQFLGMCF